MKVQVGISNRHVHLTEETFYLLFGARELEKRNDLHQIGEYASTKTVDLVYNGKKIDHVRIVGPFRNHNQVELLGRDLEFLNLNAPTRRSGNLKDTPSIWLVNGEKRIETDGVIRAERHVHVPKAMEDVYDLHERDHVTIEYPNGTFDAFVKVSENGHFEVHIDKDEAEEYGITSGMEVEICGK